MPQRVNQRERILALLKAADGGWVPLPRILALGIAQYNARIFELKHYHRHRIVNRTRVVGGVRHSEFRLVKPGEERGELERTNPTPYLLDPKEEPAPARVAESPWPRRTNPRGAPAPVAGPHCNQQKIRGVLF